MSGLERRIKWDLRFLALARFVSHWSKDPSTKVGAVIVAPDLEVVSMGYNGFPRQVYDIPQLYEDRESKYARIVHGDMNALIFAGRRAKGCTLYTHPFLPCARCAGAIIQAGIVRVVAPQMPEEVKAKFTNRTDWEESVRQTEQMFAEAGVDWGTMP